MRTCVFFSQGCLWSSVPELQQRHGLQVLSDDGVHDHLEDHLDVGGVGRRGEVVVDEFIGGGVEGDKGGGDEAGRRVNVAVRTWRAEETIKRPDPQTRGSKTTGGTLRRDCEMVIYMLG